MINATEAFAITVNTIHAKIEKGKEKAREFIPTLEECIINAAKSGADNTVIYPLRAITIESQAEKSGYLTELTNILSEAKYKIKYDASAESMKISWMG